MPRRDDVLRRSPLARWTGRVLGLAGTAVVLAVGVVVATMVLAARDEAGVTAAPAATPSATPAAERDAKPRLTARQRNERRRAADEVRRQGYKPVTLADYRVDHALRVLIGEPVGSTAPGRRAFFFVRERYIGQDASSPSGNVRPGRQREREITLVYSRYATGDRECCPTGSETRVHFRWTGDALEPREPIPPERMPPT